MSGASQLNDDVDIHPNQT